jgi:hypothetical protein
MIAQGRRRGCDLRYDWFVRFALAYLLLLALVSPIGCARDTPRRIADIGSGDLNGDANGDAGLDVNGDARSDHASDLPEPPDLGAEGAAPPPDLGASDRGPDLPSYLDGSTQAITTKPARCSVDNWCWAHPRPHGLTLNAVWASSGSNIFAVGNAGVVQRYDGASWSIATPVTQENLRACWGSSPEVLWIAGEGGVVLRYDAKTKQVASWQFGAVDLHAIWGSSATDVWVVGEQGFAAHFDGQGWQTLQLPTFNTLRALGGAGGLVYAVGDAGTVLVRGAQGWQKLGASAAVNLIALYAEAGQDALALSSTGRVFAIGGPTAVEIAAIPAGTFVRSMAGLAGTVYVLTLDFASGSPKLYRKDGAGWTALTAGPNKGIYAALWPLPGGGLALVGAYGATARYDPGTGVQPLGASIELGSLTYGMTVTSSGPLVVGRSASGDGFAATLSMAGWRVEAAPPSLLYDVWSAGGTVAFAVGKGVQRLDANGWSDVDGVYNGDLKGIWGFTSGELVVVGDRVIRRRAVAGTWSDETPTSPSVTLNFWAVWGSDPQHLFAVGSKRTTFSSNVAYGYTASAGWVDLNHPTGGTTLTAVWGSSPTDVYTGGQTALWHYDGSSWTQVSLPGISAKQRIFSIWGRGSSDVYVVAEKGRVFHKTAAGWVAEDSGVDVDLSEVSGAATGPVYIAPSGGLLAHP